MVRKVNKNLNLPMDVVEPLEDEENQSQVVTQLLREHYGVEPPTEAPLDG